MPLWLMIFFQVLPYVPTLVQTAETAFSGKPGSGAAKKSLAMNLTGIALDAASVKVPALQADTNKKVVLDAVGGAIDATVSVMNAAGIFKKAEPAKP